MFFLKVFIFLGIIYFSSNLTNNDIGSLWDCIVLSFACSSFSIFLGREILPFLLISGFITGVLSLMFFHWDFAESVGVAIGGLICISFGVLSAGGKTKKKSVRRTILW
ncbi:MAG: hypothetical protein GW795_06155 [Cyanobacteria bacterium]|nr:hypothetical protein [Cyanobacteria bacterium CG_2015-16_32_12]NCO79456.1 hypothetical protein [Cyanobacteria bacterium CG_2015-22_32_23]NCQ41469.1 hypothetical protein [Cyanobacteria bacterium CG_2015-04_32_10]NCS84297.1 hypothetical protein [Cyanobacteria bacterium CG_2015-02_32_10]